MQRRLQNHCDLRNFLHFLGAARTKMERVFWYFVARIAAGNWNAPTFDKDVSQYTQIVLWPCLHRGGDTTTEATWTTTFQITSTINSTSTVTATSSTTSSANVSLTISPHATTAKKQLWLLLLPCPNHSAANTLEIPVQGDILFERMMWVNFNGIVFT